MAQSMDHKKWIDVLSLWRSSHPTGSVSFPVSASSHHASEPSLSDLTLIKAFGLASPEASLKHDAATARGPNVVYSTYALTDAHLSSVSVTGERPTEGISLSFTKLEFKHYPYDDKNKAGTPVATTSTVTFDQASRTISRNSLTIEMTPKLGTLGDDILVGTVGDDLIVGLSGNDLLSGLDGHNFLIGGRGGDKFQVSGSDVILDLGNGADILEVAAGGTASAVLVAPWLATSATSNDGTANLTTRGFNVDLSAVSGGTHGFNVLNIGGGATLTGSKFDDILMGGSRADRLVGGDGKDAMDGFGGYDTFVFNSIIESALGANSDVIFGFAHGIDKIDLSGIDANQLSGSAGNQAFSFSNSARANSVWWERVGADTLIYGDVNTPANGVVAADFSIKLQDFSAATLTASDFVA